MRVKHDRSGSERLKKLITSEKGKVVAVGWFSDSAYPDTGEKVAAVAATHEFGAPQKNIPARSFMRPAKERNYKKWSSVVRSAGAKAIEGRDDFDYVLDQLGLEVTGDIMQAIKDVNSPPLSLATLKNRAEKANAGRKRKTFTVNNIKSKPLQDTGYMIKTVIHVIKKKGEIK
jgi:hypothetical protein